MFVFRIQFCSANKLRNFIFLFAVLSMTTYFHSSKVRKWWQIINLIILLKNEEALQMGTAVS